LRRYRFPAAIAAMFFVIVAAGFVTALAFWRQAVQQRGRAEVRAAQAELVTAFLERILSSADPEAVQADFGSPLYKSLRETADNAAREADRLADQPEVEARVRHTLGRLYMNLGAYAEAAEHLQRALELRTALYDAENPATVDTLLLLGWACKEQGQYERARRAYERGLAARQQQVGPESLATADVYNYLGQLYLDQNDLARAEPYLRDALELRRRLDAPREELANSLASMGSLLRRAGRLTEAEAPLREALEMRRALYGEEHHFTLVSMNKLALLLRAEGDGAEARALLERYVALAPKVLGSQHAHLGAALVNLGLTYADQGEHAQAESYYRRGIAVLQAARGPDHPQVGQALIHLGNALRALGRPEEALDCCGRALVLLPPGDVRRAPGLLLRGQLLYDNGDISGATAALREGAALSAERLGREHPATLRLEQALAGVLDDSDAELTAPPATVPIGGDSSGSAAPPQ
jgi:tetratricopeptide (TPR) repeat protein